MTKVPVALAWEMAKGQLAGLHDDALAALEAVFQRGDRVQVEVPCVDCGADIIVEAHLVDGVFRPPTDPRCDTCETHHLTRGSLSSNFREKDPVDAIQRSAERAERRPVAPRAHQPDREHRALWPVQRCRARPNAYGRRRESAAR